MPFGAMASHVVVAGPGHRELAVVSCVGVNQIRQGQPDCFCAVIFPIHFGCMCDLILKFGRVPKGTPLWCRWGGKQLVPQFPTAAPSS